MAEADENRLVLIGNYHLLGIYRMSKIAATIDLNRLHE
jgi:hypothetical protein